MMQKAISTTVQSFAVGCMIYMLSLCVSYWKNGDEIYHLIQARFDLIVLGIFIVSLFGGGFGHVIYQFNITYKVSVFLHYAITISAILIVSIWLKFVTMSYLHLFMYFILISVIFFIIWYVYYVKLKKEADLINAAIMNVKKAQKLS